MTEQKDMSLSIHRHGTATLTLKHSTGRGPETGTNVNEYKLRFHDLRHVLGTWLRWKGVSVDVLRELLGRRERDTTDSYATLDRIEADRFLQRMPRIKKPRFSENRGELAQNDTYRKASASQACQIFF